MQLHAARLLDRIRSIDLLSVDQCTTYADNAEKLKGVVLPWFKSRLRASPERLTHLGKEKDVELINIVSVCGLNVSLCFHLLFFIK